MIASSPRGTTPNSDAMPPPSQPITCSMKAIVCFRSVKMPNEKRMKSGFENNCAMASTSSSRKERRMSRSVSRVSTEVLKTNRARVAIHNGKMRTDNEEFARLAQPPDTTSWSAVREGAKDCEACHLYQRATQTGFGEGPKGATMMLCGEQPGGCDDGAGKPVVG